jgi:cytoskeletal protein RodZ
MNDFEQQQRKREAMRRLAAQRGRAGRLRGRVVAGSLICFVLLWGIVFGQLVTGNDPVLAAKARAAAGRQSRSGGNTRAQPSEAASEAIETTEPDEVESQVATPPPVEAEAPVEVEPEVEEFEVEPEEEVELEPLTTGQS